MLENWISSSENTKAVSEYRAKTVQGSVNTVVTLCAHIRAEAAGEIGRSAFSTDQIGDLARFNEASPLRL
jgi:hypothetical protein